LFRGRKKAEMYRESQTSRGALSPTVGGGRSSECGGARGVCCSPPGARTPTEHMAGGCNLHGQPNTPSVASVRYLSFLVEHWQCQDNPPPMPPPRSIPQWRLPGPWGPRPPRRPPPRPSSTVTVSLSKIRPAWGLSLTNTRLFAPGRTSIRPQQADRWPGGRGSEARAARGRHRRSRCRGTKCFAQLPYKTEMESQGLGPRLLGVSPPVSSVSGKVASSHARRARGVPCRDRERNWPGQTSQPTNQPQWTEGPATVVVRFICGDPWI
jgi:hypothetical protein